MRVQNIANNNKVYEGNKYSNKLALFLIVTFIFTWIFWIPDALAKREILASSIFTSLGFLGSLGPLVATVIFVFKDNEKSGLKEFFKNKLNKKVKIKWWVITFLIFPILIILAYLISVSIDQVHPVSEAAGLYMFIPVIFFSVMFTGGPVQEEFGWRGYVLPRLQKRLSPFISSLILGFIWAIWHWPQFLVPKELTGMFYVTPFWSFILTVISANFIYTWIYNKTNGSVLAVIVLHTQMNLFFWIFPVLYTQYGYLVILVIFMLAASTIVIYDKECFFNKNKIANDN